MSDIELFGDDTLNEIKSKPTNQTTPALASDIFAASSATYLRELREAQQQAAKANEAYSTSTAPIREDLKKSLDQVRAGQDGMEEAAKTPAILRRLMGIFDPEATVTHHRNIAQQGLTNLSLAERRLAVEKGIHGARQSAIKDRLDRMKSSLDIVGKVATEGRAQASHVTDMKTKRIATAKELASNMPAAAIPGAVQKITSMIEKGDLTPEEHELAVFRLGVLHDRFDDLRKNELEISQADIDLQRAQLALGADQRADEAGIAEHNKKLGDLSLKSLTAQQLQYYQNLLIDGGNAKIPLAMDNKGNVTRTATITLDQVVEAQKSLEVATSESAQRNSARGETFVAAATVVQQFGRIESSLQNMTLLPNNDAHIASMAFHAQSIESIIKAPNGVQTDSQILALRNHLQQYNAGMKSMEADINKSSASDELKAANINYLRKPDQVMNAVDQTVVMEDMVTTGVMPSAPDLVDAFALLQKDFMSKVAPEIVNAEGVLNQATMLAAALQGNNKNLVKNHMTTLFTPEVRREASNDVGMSFVKDAVLTQVFKAHPQIAAMLTYDGVLMKDEYTHKDVFNEDGEKIGRAFSLERVVQSLIAADQDLRRKLPPEQVALLPEQTPYELLRSVMGSKEQHAQFVKHRNKGLDLQSKAFNDRLFGNTGVIRSVVAMNEIVRAGAHQWQASLAQAVEEDNIRIAARRKEMGLPDEDPTFKPSSLRVVAGGGIDQAQKAQLDDTQKLRDDANTSKLFSKPKGLFNSGEIQQ